MLTVETLRELFIYEPETGLFRTRNKTRRSASGTIVGALRNDGYLQVYVKGTNYLAHRLAWFYVNGRWPSEHTDHIDGNRVNNRISNLREASAAENGRNRTRSQSSNTSGKRGVYWSAIRRKWVAQICVDRKVINLGGFLDKGAAIAARQAAETKLHGNFRGQS